MTCCIAGACVGDRVIATVSDTRASWGYASSDELFKLVRIHHPYWLGMIAGENISVAAENVTRLTAEHLSKFKAAPPTVTQVRRELRRAWQTAQNEIGESTVLAPYKIDVDGFRQSGLKRFGPAKFSELCSKLETASRLQCQLLVLGFDEQKIPTILVNDDDLGVAEPSRVGYYAIGSGHATATTMLTLQRYSVKDDLPTSIYKLCGAKFAAEKAEGVSETTIVMLLRNDGKTCIIEGQPLEALRAVWLKNGMPRAPDGDVLKTCVPQSLVKWGTL